jgi:uncharacterized membrane protein YhhN
MLTTGILQLVGESEKIFELQLLKPIPIILMILTISRLSCQRMHRILTIVGVGLAFSLAGDLCLMVNDPSVFMMGTMFFLVAHVFYCVGFSMGKKARQAGSLNRGVRMGVSLIIVSLCLKNIYQLFHVMPNRQLFTTYAVVLCVMTLFALNRYEITSSSSYKITLIGALLFGLSDNLLGYLKFNGISTKYGRSLVMLLYYTGQYLIMRGTILHSNFLMSAHGKTEGSGTANK